MHVLSEIATGDQFTDPPEELIKSLGDALVPGTECSFFALELAEDVPVVFKDGEIAGHVENCTCCQRRDAGQAGLN